MADLVFDGCDFLALEFNDLVAILADDVVVIWVLGVVRIVELVVLPKIHLPNQAAFRQQGQRTIDGCTGNGFILFP